ncbi:MAG: valine--tRNA ligase [Candidatus Diapherotrites archaeon CG08_land_8_20_14_0_20_30_16]|nr:MAG: valine--tRNA ligase [Candidatus Diapherotrites archaeon CG08_land_8_20_14_0_20_30_16]
MEQNTEIKEKQKDYKEIEKDIWLFWQKEQIFKYDPNSTNPVFSIDTPPPTVSGKMHLGHAYSYVLPDFIARYKRKKGFNVFYPFGLDDNGIPTEILVEKLANVRAKDIGKSKFVELCVKHTKESEEELYTDFKSLGISCDWSLLYRTISPEVVRVAQYSFLDLYKKGKIYREKGPILWCTKCQTAISQAELVDVEKETYFNDIIFKLDNGENITIATTRPEFLSACVGIFVHPDDDRYKHLIGKHATVPLFNFKVKIRKDKRVDQNKGTGIVMCCTFGDQTDMEWYKTYKLELKEAITVDGHMSNICGKYAGMKIEDARKEIITDLKQQNLLLEQKKISHTVNCHERGCGVPVEIIVESQWYIDYLKDKKMFIKEANKIKWYPKHMKVRYDNWIKNLQWNWCISRQRYSGVPFPVWFCKTCGKETFADPKDLPIYPEESKPKQKCQCGSNEFIAESSIMDTWSISALTPLINMGWPDKDVSQTIPMSMRPQGQDIITLWAFNTIVKSLYHIGRVPWNNLMINGYVLDAHGEKMSKSKGNVIAPQETLEKWGKDPFRYWCAQVTLGDDIAYSEKEMQAAQKMIIKLENANKFVDMLLQNYSEIPTKVKLNCVDKWILSKLSLMIKTNTKDMENYDYSHTIQRLRDFFFIDFCDNYLEFIKYRVYGNNQKSKDAVAHTLFNVAFQIVNQLSVFMPFVCEDIYQKHFKKYINTKSITLCNWPEFGKINKKDIETGEFFKEIIGQIRKYKTQKNLSMKTELQQINITINKDLPINLKRELCNIMFVKNIVFTEGKGINILE